MNRRQRMYVLGTVVLLAFAGFTLASFRENLTPYVSFQEARHLDRNLQVAGALEAGSTRYDPGEQALLFTLVEAGTDETMPVTYRGVKPANFEEAISIVAIGRWDPSRGHLAADQLLVKCPSKYQGVESAETKQYG